MTALKAQEEMATIEPLRVLVFEDHAGDAKQIANELQRLAPVLITWFKRVPGKLGARHAQSAYFPLEAATAELPRIGPTFEQMRRGKNRWWQADFDAAIVDVFQGAQPAGEDFARWMEWARFYGPVALVTWYNHSTATFPLLPCLVRISKKDNDWHKRAVDVLDAHFETTPTGRQRVDATRPTVGTRGRDPADPECVKRYWQHLAPRAAQRADRWLSLWVGDPSAAKHVHNFLDQEDLQESFQGVWKEAIRAARHRGEFVDEARSWPLVLENAFTLRLRCPNVVWIDCGTADCDVNATLAPVRAMHDRSWLRRPLVVLLAERLAGLTADAQKELGHLGVVVVQRSLLLEQPARWAEETVEQFALALEVTRRAEKAGANDAYQIQLIEKLFQAYLRLLLIARSKRYVMGEKDIESVVRWLSAYPLSGEVVKTSFQHFSNRSWKRLRAAGRISDAVFDMITKERKGDS